MDSCTIEGGRERDKEGECVLDISLSHSKYTMTLLSLSKTTTVIIEG